MEIQHLGVFIIVVLLVNFVAVGFMLSAFGIVFWRRGWEAAMRRDERGRWPIALKLMFSGACMGLLLVPFYLVLIGWGKYLLGDH
jgi:uncharacterized membrane protein